MKTAGNRIAIVGTTGSGKTTLARQVAQCLQIQHFELDALHWEPNWIPAEDEVFQARVGQALEGDRWVVDGNYSKVRSIVWQRADTIVWLDYPFWLVLNRLFRRTWRRSFLQEELWSGNRENFRISFLSQDSILIWFLRTYAKRRKQYPILFQQPEYSHLSIVHLQSPQMTNQWLESLEIPATES